MLIEMSVILDFDVKKISKVFFGSSPSDIKRTVVMTLGIPWFFRRLKRQRFIVKKNEGWWNLAVMRCEGAEATLISVGSGSCEVTDVIRLLTKFQCKNIVGIGLAGALKKDIKIGDMLIPIQCVQAFVTDVNKIVCHSEELYSAYKNEVEGFCSKTNISLHQGRLCTVDSVTSENVQFFSYAQSLGFSGVDMETFYLYREAVRAGFRVSSFHVVSDNPVAHKSFLDRIPDYDIERKNKTYRRLPLLVRSVACAISEKEV
jgi:purine-nucleoside phosphorylase